MTARARVTGSAAPAQSRPALAASPQIEHTVAIGPPPVPEPLGGRQPGRPAVRARWSTCPTSRASLADRQPRVQYTHP